MKTKIKLLTVALCTISLCPATTMCMMSFIRALKVGHRVGRVLIRGRGGICRPSTGARAMRTALRNKLSRSASQQTKVIKFGGSVLTDKEKPNRGMINYDSIHYLAKQTSDYFRYNPDTKQVYIITGAGAQAHKMANEYKDNLQDGAPEIRELTEALSLTLMDRLNKEFDKNNIDKKAVFFNSIPTITKNGQIHFIAESNGEYYDTRTLHSLVKKENIVAILNATVTSEARILSGDKLAFLFGECFDTDPGFVSSAGGIHDEYGEIISMLNSARAEKLFDGTRNAMSIIIDDETGIPIVMGTSSYKYDVSGGPRERVNLFCKSQLARMYIIAEESVEDFFDIESPIDFFKKQIKGTMLVKTDEWAVCSGYTKKTEQD